MDLEAKKTALRMVPYGIYVLTAIDGETVAAAGVSWVTQTSFDPPLLVVCIRRDSATFEVVQASNSFALHVLASDQAEVANSFFRAVAREGDTIAGIPFAPGPATGSPVLEGVPAHVECVVREVAEVTDAVVHREIEGRPDAVTLTCAHISPKLFYAG